MDCSLENDDAENFALHLLNDDCLLELYKYLKLKNAKSLAATSNRLKNLFMIRYHKFTFEFHSNMFNKTSKNGKQVLDNILSEYGQYLRSWSLTVDMYEEIEENRNAGAEVLKIVSEYSTNLNRLELKGFYIGFDNFFRECGNAAVCFANVETLIFERCYMVGPFEFLQCFRKLKHLHFTESGTTTSELQIMFKNNPGIESYYNNDSDSLCGDSHNFGQFTSKEFNLCEFGPKFHKLCLGACCDSLEWDNLLRLTTINLTSLKIEFLITENLTIFLTELAKKGVLKELELVMVPLDRKQCNIIQSFQNLELIVLRPEYVNSDLNSKFTLDANFIWPPKLKRLRSTIEMTDDGFIALISQLKFLTYLQLDLFRNYDRCFERYQLIPFMGDSRRPTLHILIGSHHQMCIDYRDSVIYPKIGRNENDDNFIEIDFSIPKCNKRMTFSY